MYVLRNSTHLKGVQVQITSFVKWVCKEEPFSLKLNSDLGREKERVCLIQFMLAVTLHPEAQNRDSSPHAKPRALEIQ